MPCGAWVHIYVYLYAARARTRHLSTHVLKCVSPESPDVLTSSLVGLYGGIIPSSLALILVVIWAGATPSDPILFIAHVFECWQWSWTSYKDTTTSQRKIALLVHNVAICSHYQIHHCKPRTDHSMNWYSAGRTRPTFAISYIAIIYSGTSGTRILISTRPRRLALVCLKP